MSCILNNLFFFIFHQEARPNTQVKEKIIEKPPMTPDEAMYESLFGAELTDNEEIIVGTFPEYILNLAVTYCAQVRDDFSRDLKKLEPQARVSYHKTLDSSNKVSRLYLLFTSNGFIII
jgi:hypothetical protein